MLTNHRTPHKEGENNRKTGAIPHHPTRDNGMDSQSITSSSAVLGSWTHDASQLYWVPGLTMPVRLAYLENTQRQVGKY